MEKKEEKQKQKSQKKRIPLIAVARIADAHLDESSLDQWQEPHRRQAQTRRQIIATSAQSERKHEEFADLRWRDDQSCARKLELERRVDGWDPC